MNGTATSLSSMANLVAGHPFRGALHDETPGGVAVVAMAATASPVLTRDTELPGIAFAGDIDKLQLAPGDILFRARGANNQSIFVESAQQACIFAAPLVRIRVNDPQQLDPHYLHWVLNSASIQRDISAQARGSMIRMVSLPSVRGLLVPIPPLRVQLEIAEVARLLREEQALCAALLSTTQTYAERLLWAKAQATTTP
jgi:hypothetical protein